MSSSSKPPGLFGRIKRALTPEPRESPAMKATRALILQLTEPLDDEEVAAAIEHPFADVALPDTRSLDTAELSQLLELGASSLNELEDPFQAGRLACFCGTLVEGGAPAALVTEALAERLDRHSSVLCALLDQAGDVRDIEPHREEFPEAYRTWQGARLLNMAVMTAFCRDLDGRVRLRARPGLVARIQRIGNRVTNGVYVDRLLACADRVRFVLIHPAQARGFVLNASAVRNNFHLWILLEDTLLQDDYLFDPRPGQPATERARLHFFEPYAWRDWPLALITEAATVDGFASPTALEVVGGELPVLLAAPSTTPTSWPKAYAALLHDAHQPRVDVERELARAEVDQWLARCAAP
jgi:hypothetical protein